MLQRSFLLLVIVCGLGASPPPPNSDAPRKVILGYIESGRVFTLERVITSGPDITFDTTSHDATLYLSHRPLPANQKVKPQARVDRLYGFADPEVPLRWRVFRGRLFQSNFGEPYSAFQSVSLAKMDRYWESGDRDFREDDDSGLSLSGDLYRESGYLDGAPWGVGPAADLLSDLRWTLMNKLEDVRLPKRGWMNMANQQVSYDLLPTKDRRATLFWRHDGWMHVADGEQRPVDDGFEERWSKPARFRVPFDEHFHVFARGKDYYFVTLGGAVYHAPEPRKGEQRVTKRLELPGNLNLVLHDSDSGKTFGFILSKRSKDGMAGGCYVELAPNSKPRKFEAKQISPLRALQPMPAVFDSARLLLDDKCIVGK